MKRFVDIYKNILMLTQFGLSFITPLLLCLALCWWLNMHVGVGAWVYLLGLFFGMGGSGMVAYKFYLSVVNRQKKEENRGRKERRSFNRHI